MGDSLARRLGGPAARPPPPATQATAPLRGSRREQALWSIAPTGLCGRIGAHALGGTAHQHFQAEMSIFSAQWRGEGCVSIAGGVATLGQLCFHGVFARNAGQFVASESTPANRWRVVVCARCRGRLEGSAPVLPPALPMRRAPGSLSPLWVGEGVAFPFPIQIATFEA